MIKKVKISEICNRVIFYVVSDACLVHQSVVDHTGRMVDGYEFNPEKMLGVHLGFNIHYFWTLEDAKKYIVENNVEVIKAASYPDIHEPEYAIPKPMAEKPISESPKGDIARKGLNEQRIRVNKMDLPKIEIRVLDSLKPVRSSIDVFNEINEKLDKIIVKADAGAFRKVVIDDILSSREKAISFLNEVGICDKDGNLIYPYNGKRKENKYGK